MRIFKYKCPSLDPWYNPLKGTAECIYTWNPGERSVCCNCGIAARDVDTIWDHIRSGYYALIPFDYRPKNIWSRFKNVAFRRCTTIKPRTLDHGWCDSDALMLHIMFEIARTFLEKEGPKTDEEWAEQKEANPAFYASWIETKELVNWWLTVYDDCYPHNLSEAEVEKLEKEQGKSSYYISVDFEELTRSKAKRLVDISPFWWT